MDMVVTVIKQRQPSDKLALPNYDYTFTLPDGEVIKISPVGRGGQADDMMSVFVLTCDMAGDSSVVKLTDGDVAYLRRIRDLMEVERVR